MMAKLDLAVANGSFLDLWSSVTLVALPRHCSDHHPLCLSLASGSPTHAKPFRFQKMWTLHEHFMDLVRSTWSQPAPGDPISRMVFKLRRLKERLKIWNRETFGNVYTDID